jgi:hypothetical protein
VQPPDRQAPPSPEGNEAGSGLRYTRSMTAAIAWPNPMHIVAIP